MFKDLDQGGAPVRSFTQPGWKPLHAERYSSFTTYQGGLQLESQEEFIFCAP